MAKNKGLAGRRRMTPWIGDWLRQARQGANERLSDVAERLRSDISTISRLETGTCTFPADDLPVILKAYGLTALEFAQRASKEAA